MDRVDLRSDTVTHPTEEMYRQMEAAPLGDDVFGDDPTVNRLEQVSADRLGKEAAVFVPTGTMANTIAIGTLTQPGDEMLLMEDSHIYLYRWPHCGCDIKAFPIAAFGPTGFMPINRFLQSL